MSKVYLSPSNHGVGQNKCLQKDCYEDKHTRPIAEVCAKYLELSGVSTKIAKAETGVMNGARTKESNAFGSDLYVPIHTNAAGASARYLLFMFYQDNAEYRKIFNAVAPKLEEIYPNKKKAQFKVRQDLYEIKSPKAKTLYCELGFHTNKTDVEKFIHEAEKVGKTLAQGICEYLGVAFKGESAPQQNTPQKPQNEPKKDKIAVDGKWGVDTTKESQKALKTTVDGYVSNQLRSCMVYLPNMLSVSWKFKRLKCGGSPLVKAIQRLVDVGADGYMGKDTVIKLQIFLKDKGFYSGKIDGYAGIGTVKGWQMYLNSL